MVDGPSPCQLIMLLARCAPIPIIEFILSPVASIPCRKGSTRIGGNMTDRLGCQFVYVAVLVIHGFMSRRRRCREILADIGGKAILVRALWKRWRMFRRVALGRAELGSGGVAAVSPVVTSVVGRNNCGCLDDLFFCVLASRTLWVIAGIVLAQARAEDACLESFFQWNSRICLSANISGAYACHLNSVLSRLS
jgi:hypothetical protein